MAMEETGGIHGCPRPEVLAPAGDLDAAFAAFEHGADAVYVGLRRFSARAEAANLSADEVGELTAYAHALSSPRRVYATVNTLVQQAELPGVVDALAVLAESGVDAVIVQDLGVARIARSLFPSLRLHASTQMAVHTAAGARVLRDLGFRRVVLARELSLAEIREVAAGGGLDVEVFVHGALCYCTSGLCLYSSHLRGRSGNRGRCAYPCRDRFRSDDGDLGHPFSMKDLSRADRVGDLAAAGVAALKIEGRMKGPLYVACLSRLYRGLVDDTLSRAGREALAEDARTVFSRLPTDLYLDGAAHRGAVDTRNVGHRGARIGEAVAVTGRAPARSQRPRPQTARRLRFTTSRPLERHDGLQIDLPGRSEPYGFAVGELWVTDAAGRPARSAFAAEAGACVEVALPADAPAIPAGAPVYCASSQAVKRAYTFTRPRPGTWAFRRPLHVDLAVRADAIGWSARTEVNLPGAPAATAAGAYAGRFDPARSPEAPDEAARQAFAKLGGTRLTLAGLRVDNPGGLFVPISVLNGVRRAVTDAAGAAAERVRDEWVRARLSAVEQECEPEPAPAGRPSAREGALPQRAARPVDSPCSPREAAPQALTWLLRTDQAACLAGFEASDWEAVDELTVELNADGPDEWEAWLPRCPLPRDRVRLALPPVARGPKEAALAAAVRRRASEGWTRWDVSSLAGVTVLREAGATAAAGFDLTADWPLYTLNAQAAAQLADLGVRRLTLSPEDDLGNWRRLPAWVLARAVVTVYQDTPLFTSETCGWPEPCARCHPDTCPRRERAMVSAAGDRVIAVTRHCRTTVVNEHPFCLSGVVTELGVLGLRCYRVDLIHRAYTADRARSVWRALRAGRSPGPAHTGNIRRGIDAGARGAGAG